MMNQILFERVQHWVQVG